MSEALRTGIDPSTNPDQVTPGIAGVPHPRTETDPLARPLELTATAAPEDFSGYSAERLQQIVDESARDADLHRRVRQGLPDRYERNPLNPPTWDERIIADAAEAREQRLGDLFEQTYARDLERRRAEGYTSPMTADAIDDEAATHAARTAVEAERLWTQVYTDRLGRTGGARVVDASDPEDIFHRDAQNAADDAVALYNFRRQREYEGKYERPIKGSLYGERRDGSIDNPDERFVGRAKKVEPKAPEPENPPTTDDDGPEPPETPGRHRRGNGDEEPTPGSDDESKKSRMSREFPDEEQLPESVLTAVAEVARTKMKAEKTGQRFWKMFNSRRNRSQSRMSAYGLAQEKLRLAIIEASGAKGLDTEGRLQMGLDANRAVLLLQIHEASSRSTGFMSRFWMHERGAALKRMVPHLTRRAHNTSDAVERRAEEQYALMLAEVEGHVGRGADPMTILNSMNASMHASTAKFRGTHQGAVRKVLKDARKGVAKKVGEVLPKRQDRVGRHVAGILAEQRRRQAELEEQARSQREQNG